MRGKPHTVRLGEGCHGRGSIGVSKSRKTLLRLSGIAKGLSLQRARIPPKAGEAMKRFPYYIRSRALAKERQLLTSATMMPWVVLSTRPSSIKCSAFRRTVSFGILRR